MTDPPRRRVVAAQTPVAGPSSGSTSQPRIRAKVDLSAISTPTGSPRPSLRSTPSSSSISNNARSPVAPPAPTRTMSSTSTPIVRARTTPLQRASTSTPIITPSKPALTRPILSRPPSSASNVVGSNSVPINPVDRGRVKVKSPSITSLSTPTAPRSLSHSRPSSRQSVSDLPPPPKSAPMLPTQSQRSDSSTSELTRITSHHSSPGKQLTALPPHLRPGTYPLHPTSSCPPSPPIGETLPATHVPHASHLSHARTNRLLPMNPNTRVQEQPRIQTPGSPELKTIDLPIMTPRRTSEASQTLSRENSHHEETMVGPGHGDLEFRDSWSGMTAVEAEYDYPDAYGIALKITGLGIIAGQPTPVIETMRSPDELESVNEIGGKGMTTSQILDEDAEQAKINRKIADLEISNASLMAINRSLEAAKAKQRAEIIKLRRALRKSTDGNGHAGPSFRPFFSLPVQSPLPEDISEGDTTDDAENEIDMDDPELEKRWEDLQDLVVVMQKRADKAVQMGWETVRAPTRVLDWVNGDEDEMGDVSADLTPVETRGGTPEG